MDWANSLIFDLRSGQSLEEVTEALPVLTVNQTSLNTYAVERVLRRSLKPFLSWLSSRPPNVSQYLRSGQILEEFTEALPVPTVNQTSLNTYAVERVLRRSLKPFLSWLSTKRLNTYAVDRVLRSSLKPILSRLSTKRLSILTLWRESWGGHWSSSCHDCQPNVSQYLRCGESLEEVTEALPVLTVQQATKRLSILTQWTESWGGHWSPSCPDCQPNVSILTLWTESWGGHWSPSCPDCLAGHQTSRWGRRGTVARCAALPRSLYCRLTLRTEVPGRSWTFPPVKEAASAWVQYIQNNKAWTWNTSDFNEIWHAYFFL